MTVRAGSALLFFHSSEKAEKVLEAVTEDRNGGTGEILSQEEIQQYVDQKVLLEDPGIIALRVWGHPDLLDNLIRAGN